MNMTKEKKALAIAAREHLLHKRHAVCRVFELALLLNPKPTDRETVGNVPTVFLNFSGHVGTIDVRVFPTGWYAGADAERRFEFTPYGESCCGHPDAEECMEYLEELFEQQKKPASAANTDELHSTGK